MMKKFSCYCSVIKLKKNNKHFPRGVSGGIPLTVLRTGGVYAGRKKISGGSEDDRKKSSFLADLPLGCEATGKSVGGRTADGRLWRIYRPR